MILNLLDVKGVDEKFCQTLKKKCRFLERIF
jgi:hypothetical protein